MVTKGGLATLVAGLLLAFGAAALDAPQWPPPEAEVRRMRELQAEISSKEATPGRREAARQELGKLLKAPGAAPPPRSPARAAVQPQPSIPAPNLAMPVAPRVDPDDVARLEVVGPSRAIVNPATGTLVAPVGSTVIDLRSGTVLVETPSGYVDPRNGRLIPK